MDKNINDNDRIIIGVREWAIGETLKSLDPWLNPNAREVKDNVGKVVEYAKGLEEYVLREITV